MDLQVEPRNVGVLGKSVLSRSYRNLFDSGDDGMGGEFGRGGMGSRSGSPERRASRRGSALGGAAVGGGLLGTTHGSPPPHHRLQSSSMLGSVNAGQSPLPKPFSAHSTEAEDSAFIAEAVKRVTTASANNQPQPAAHSAAPDMLSRSNSTVSRTITTPGGGNKRRSFLTTLQSLSAAPAEPPAHAAAMALLGGVGGSPNKGTKASISEPAAAKKPYRNSFQGSADTGRPSSRMATPNFPAAEVHSLAHVKKSADLGKTVGIPDIKNIGIMPVRTSISTDRDSTQHFLYLRVSTTADGIDNRPTSILTIARDREREIAKLKASRQTAQYKAVRIVCACRV